MKKKQNEFKEFKKRIEEAENSKYVCDSCGARVKKAGYRGNMECEFCLGGKLGDKPETDIMGFPKGKDVKIFDFDKAQQQLHPQKDFTLKYMINDEQGNPVWKYKTLQAKDSWDAKVKMTNEVKDAFNIQVQ